MSVEDNAGRLAEWISCPHVNTQITITREAKFERCDDCGAERVTFAVEPLLKDGAAIGFRPNDFKRVH